MALMKSLHAVEKIEKRPGCVQAALSIMGDQWSPLLLAQLVEADKTFSELESALDGISPRTLSARLDKLEIAKVIARDQYCEHPPRFRYGLTQKGKELQDILVAMGEWGNRYFSEMH